jgi:calcineurin-like phosphoesterase family protein
MSIVRVISDPHFGHLNMAIRRGFNDQHEMNELMVERWNSVVGKRDVTYILGDITMEKESEYYWLDSLNGIKKVILGNHDKPQHVQKLLKHVNSVAASKYWTVKGVGNVIITHIPIHPSELEYRFKFNIHGHVHGNTIDDDRYINVSAEVIDYIPRTLEELFHR